MKDERRENRETHDEDKGTRVVSGSPSGPPESWPIGCSGCTGCCTLPGGIICIILGLIPMFKWYQAGLECRERSRGMRIDMPLDFSRKGTYTAEVRVLEDTPDVYLELCFCEKYGRDRVPPPEALRELRFSATVKEAGRPSYGCCEYRGEGIKERWDKIRLLDDLKLYRAVEKTITIEVDVIRPTPGMKGVPAAIYLSRFPREGVPYILATIFLFFPAVAFLALGAVLIGGAFVRRRYERLLRETSPGFGAMGSEDVSPKHTGPEQNNARNGDARRRQELTLNLPDIVTTIDRLLKKTMLGGSKFDPSLLLVARALASEVENPGRTWIIYEVALEAASQSATIGRVREALSAGRPLPGGSTFDVTEDTWVCYVAVESAEEQRRAVAVEILDAYAFDDCGCILDVNVLRAMPSLPDSGVRHWVLDLEDVGGISDPAQKRLTKAPTIR